MPAAQHGHGLDAGKGVVSLKPLKLFQTRQSNKLFHGTHAPSVLLKILPRSRRTNLLQYLDCRRILIKMDSQDSEISK